MSDNTIAKLLAAGYQREQIISCPLNDSRENCPCDKAGPQQHCAFSSKDKP